MLKVKRRSRGAGLYLITLLGCLSIIFSVQTPGYAQDGIDWVFQTVDSAGDVGMHTSLAFGSGPAISYYDWSDSALKLAYDRNYDGDFADAGEITTVDRIESVGSHTSAAFGTGPAISYHEGTNLDLKLANDRNNDGDFTDADEITTVDSAGYVGAHTSLAIGSGPAISYYDIANGDLKLAYDRNDNGYYQGPGEIITVDSDGYVGEYTSLAFGSGPAISYYDWSNGDLKLAYDRNNDGDFTDTDEIITVDSDGDVGMYTSLAFGTGPAISYYDMTNGDLKLAYDRNNNGDFTDTGEIITVDSTGDVGMHTSLAFGSGPAISYYDKTNGNLKLAWDMNDNGDFTDTGEIIIVDSAGDVGEYTSLAFDTSGGPAISYYDASNGDLKLASSSPPPPPTPLPSHTWTFSAAGFFPKHLPDSYNGEVVLADLDPAAIPAQVQGVWWWDDADLEWKLWVPGVGGVLTTLGGGHTYDYMVLVTGACDWEIPLP